MKKLNKVETQAWTSLIRAQQILIDKIERELKAHGLPPLNWYDILWALESSPEGRLRLNDIGNVVLLNKYNVTRLVNRLEEKGLVSKTNCQQDGRGIFACVTEKGKETRKKMWYFYRNILNKKFFSNYSEDELINISSLMKRIVNIDQN